MAKAKKINMDKLKASVKKTTADHGDWKERIKNAVNEGEHKSAETAIKLLTKTRDSLNKMLEHVQGHADKKKPKEEMTAN